MNKGDFDKYVVGLIYSKSKKLKPERLCSCKKNSYATENQALKHMERINNDDPEYRLVRAYECPENPRKFHLTSREK